VNPSGNLFAAKIALRDTGDPSLLVALDYLALLAEVKANGSSPPVGR
jgi:hypothetical protein